MTRTLLCVLVTACFASCSQLNNANEPPSSPPGYGVRATPRTEITWNDLNEHPVIGRLGVPMGTVVDITATIVTGKNKMDDGAFLLRVSEVGHSAIEPAEIPFYVQSWGRTQLASDDFKLYELKTGKKTSALHEDQVRELRRGYVGQQVRVTVYEEGGFSGIPRNLPEDVLDWQDHGYRFETRLIVMRQR